MIRTEADYWQLRSSQEQNHQELEHAERMNVEVTRLDMATMAMLHPKIGIDGNQWYVLYGENLQDGVAGFGDTPLAAIQNFNHNFCVPLKTALKAEGKKGDKHD